MTTPGDTCRSGRLIGHLALDQQVALLHDLIDSTPDAIIAHEPDGTIAFYSGGACELLGLSKQQMSALGPYGWIAPEAMRGSTVRLAKILSEGELTFESQALRADGTVIPTEVVARRLETVVGPLIVSVIRDVSVRKRAQERLEFLAYHDSLTGLWNRTAFDQRLSLAIADAQRHGDLLALAYIDLDKFKPINDRHGHETGDAVLVEIGQRLESTVRQQDAVARLGGDEFVVLLPRTTTVSELGPVAERLLAVIREPIKACGADCVIEASLGMAVYDSETDDARALVVKADIAMYAAKQDPEHEWLLYDRSMGLLPPDYVTPIDGA